MWSDKSLVLLLMMTLSKLFRFASNYHKANFTTYCVSKAVQQTVPRPSLRRAQFKSNQNSSLS